MPCISTGARRLFCLIPALFALLVIAAPAQASGTPDLQLSGGPAPSVLYGNQVPVSLTASLGAGPKGYNLAYRAVLPAGVSYVAASAGNDGEPQIINNAPTAGKTTLIWPNVDDLVASSSHTLDFKVTYNTTSSAGSPKYDVGDTIPIDTGAYISTQPRDETDFNAAGQPVGPGAGTYTGKAEQSSITNLTAIKIAKSEPHPEGEIPRGVHDQQTVYTLTITNNDVNPTNTVSAEDYIPAGLEFLGCAGTSDHTTDAPTNSPSAQEYPGSGAITVAHPTAAEDCVAPDLVETVNVDPDGAGPLPSGVYTHVKWNSLGNFPASGVKKLTYGAAIPIRENTMDWNGAGAGNGTAPADTGAQAVNLDNNSGPETYDEQPLLNGAMVAGTYQAPAKPGKAVSDEGTLLRTAEDIAIQKSNDNGGLNQGDLTTWKIDLQVSEYRYVDNVRIHDVTPNGLCPLGPVNETTNNNPASDNECNPVGGRNPSQPYTTINEQPDGTFDMTWDSSTFPSLARLQPNETRHLEFSTRTRQNYQSNFLDTTPVLSRDAVSNNIDTAGTDFVRCSGGTPDCSSGTKIAHDEVEGVDDVDVSQSGKEASGPVILKQVADQYPASGDCNDLAAASYGKTVPVYGPGDQVCWKLRLDFPTLLDTASQDVFDVLPAGLDYVPGSAQVTANDTIPVGTVDTSDPGRLRWPIGAMNDIDKGGQIFEVTFKTTVGSPLGHHSGDVEGNLQKFSFTNTAGKAFTLRDKTDFKLKMPELSLLKGVREINGNGTIFGPNSDHKQVQGGDSVQYRVDLTNTGTAPATATRVWDSLPIGISCTDVQIGSISDGGSCNPAFNRIEWGGLAVPGASGSPSVGGTHAPLTYKVTVPVGVSPDQSYVNTAGVVEFTYTTNEGHPFQLIPANDPLVKDPALGTPNAPKAQDVSDIYTPAASVVKTRTTSVSEAGNDANTQAAIGETIDYTVTTTIPKGTTLYGSPTVVDPLGSRQTLVPGSLCSPASSCTFDGATLPAGGVSVSESPSNTITATFPVAVSPAASYANTTGHDVQLVLHFKAKVLDVNANVRGSNLPNTATLTFKDQLDRTVTHAGTVNTTIVEPKIALAKSHTPSGRLSPGQIVDYSITASNGSGSNVSTAHDVVATDTVPTGTDPVDAGGVPIADGAAVSASGGIWHVATRTIVWDKATTPALAALAPGASTILTYRAKLESAPVGGQSYTNVVDATTTSLDGSVPGVRTPASTSSTAPDYKAHAQDVILVVLPSITKDSSPDPVTIGTNVVWHVHVTIPKNVQFYDANVVDTLPDGVDIDSYGSQTCVSGCPASDQAITHWAPVYNAPPSAYTITTGWFLGDLAPSANDRVYDFVINGHVLDHYRTSGGAFPVLDGQTLTNSAITRSDRTDQVGPTMTNSLPGFPFDDTVGPATAVNHVVEPKLTIDKSADKGPFVEGGDHVTYTIAVKNTGTSPAHDVVVDDTPDSELTNVQLVAGAGFNTDPWTAGNPHMQWVVPGPIAVGATVTLTYTADVKAATSLTAGAVIHNTANIVAYYGAPKTERDAGPGAFRTYTGPNDSVDLTVALPDLSIVKTPDHGAATAGSPSSFTIKVKNNDTHATAHNVVVHDVLQAGLHYAGGATASPAAGFSETGASGQTIDWKVISLAPGATVTITVPVTVDPSVPNGTNLLNRASTHADEVPTDKTDTGSLDVVAKTDLAVTKTSPPGDVLAGGNVTYTITTHNNGPSDALNSHLADTLPSYLTFVALDDPGNCAVAGQAITCNYGTLVPGATRTLHVTAKVDPSRTAPIRNDVDVTTTTTETDPANNHDHADNTIKPVADVSILKTSDRTAYNGGDLVTYTLVAHNDGPADALNTVVDDDIPSDLTFQSVSPGAPTCTVVAAHVHCDLGTLAAGASRTVTIVTKAKGAPPSNDPTTAHEHKITVDKAEQYVSLQSGATQTIDLTCPSNGIAADGEVQVVDVDQSQSPVNVQVIQASSISLGTYRFVVTNTTSGQAQIRPHVTCLPHDTDDGLHPIDVGSLKTLNTGSLAPGRYDFTIPVAIGHHGVAPGIDVTSGNARLVASEPSGNSWKFTVEVLQTATATLSLRELSDTTGLGGSPPHVHAFSFLHIARTVTIGPGRTNQIRVSCPVGYEGIVSTYDLPPGVVSLGNVPEPINRDFDLFNTTNHNVDVVVDLECISIDTGPPLDNVLPVVNTATVGSATFDPNLGNNSSSATITVARAAGSTLTPPPPVTHATPPVTHATPPVTHATPPVAARVATSSFGTVTVSSTGSSASIPVTCKGTATCSGTVTMSAKVATPSTRAVSKKAKSKTVVLGKAAYKVKPGQTVKVTVKITTRYRSLAKSGKVRSATVSSGKATSVKKVVVAKKKKKKSSRH